MGRSEQDEAFDILKARPGSNSPGSVTGLGVVWGPIPHFIFTICCTRSQFCQSCGLHFVLRVLQMVAVSVFFRILEVTVVVSICDVAKSWDPYSMWTGCHCIVLLDL